MKNATPIAQPTRPVTQQAIADRCGVHVTTVSLALRGRKGLVNAETMARIRAVAAEMDYDPRATDHARQLRALRSGTRPLNHLVGLVTPKSLGDETYFFTMFRAIITVLAAEGISVCPVFTDDFESGNLPPVVTRGDLDALITFWPPEMLLNTYPHPPMPLVSLIFSHPGYPAVVVDNRAGTFAITTRLLELGHRHFLMDIPPTADKGYSGQRAAGCRDACRAWGLDPLQHLHDIAFQPYGYDQSARDWVWEQLQVSLHAHPDTTAIIAGNDFIAVQIYEALQLGGIRVPEDISLTGFDDTHVITGGGKRNILTTVSVPLYDVGAEAARICLRMLRKEPVSDTPIVFPVKFIPRRSIRAV